MVLADELLACGADALNSVLVGVDLSLKVLVFLELSLKVGGVLAERKVDLLAQ